MVPAEGQGSLHLQGSRGERGRTRCVTQNLVRPAPRFSFVCVCRRKWRLKRCPCWGSLSSSPTGSRARKRRPASSSCTTRTLYTTLLKRPTTTRPRGETLRGRASTGCLLCAEFCSFRHTGGSTPWRRPLFYSIDQACPFFPQSKTECEIIGELVELQSEPENEM